MLNPIPVSEIEEDSPRCAECNDLLEGMAEFFDGSYLCESCMISLGWRLRTEAEQFATQNCKITRPIPEYDPDLEYRCSPEDYESGARESYTPNAFLAYCRHCHTNYDELLKPLDKHDHKDLFMYKEIRKRIISLLRAEVEKLECGEIFDEFFSYPDTYSETPWE